METTNDKAIAAAQAAGLLPAVQMKEQILALFDPNREGFEGGVDITQLTIPRAKLLQGLSPEVQAEPRLYYAGMLINSITKETLAPSFIPLRTWKSWVRFNPRSKEAAGFDPNVPAGDVIWQSLDHSDPRVKSEAAWGPNNEPPLATEFINFLCYFEGFTIPLVLSFSKTSYKAGKDFFTMAFGYGGAMYSRKYTLTAKQDTNEKGTFYVLGVKGAGKCSEDELAIGKTLYEAFAKPAALKVHEEDREAGSEG